MDDYVVVGCVVQCDWVIGGIVLYQYVGEGGMQYGWVSGDVVGGCVGDWVQCLQWQVYFFGCSGQVVWVFVDGIDQVIGQFVEVVFVVGFQLFGSQCVMYFFE